MLLKDNIQRLVNNAYSELGLLIYTYEKHIVRKEQKWESSLLYEKDLELKMSP